MNIDELNDTCLQVEFKNSKVKQEKPHTRRSKYQNTDSNHTIHIQPQIHKTTHTYMRLHTFSHIKLTTAKLLEKRHETNIKVRVTRKVPPCTGQWQKRHWGGGKPD